MLPTLSAQQVLGFNAVNSGLEAILSLFSNNGFLVALFSATVVWVSFSVLRLLNAISRIKLDFSRVQLVFKTAGDDITSLRVREILQSTDELRATKNLWRNLLGEFIPRASQNTGAKIQIAKSIEELLSVSEVAKVCVGIEQLALGPVVTMAILSIVGCLVAFISALAVFIGSDSAFEMLKQSASALVACGSFAGLSLFVHGAVLWYGHSTISYETGRLIGILKKHFDASSDTFRLSSLQRDITRLGVQISLMEATVAGLSQPGSRVYPGSNVAAANSKQLAVIPAGVSTIRTKQEALEQAASSVRDVVSMIDVACDTISFDLESAYRKLFNKYGTASSKISSASAAVVPGVIETKLKIGETAHSQWREWNTCKKTQPAFDGLNAFLDNAENCVITLTNLKNNIIELGMNHASSKGGEVSTSEVGKFTQDYILMGDIIAEIRNSIGKISANNHDISESWQSLQGQLEGLNRSTKDKLSAARGIVSGFYKTVSYQMNQIQGDLSNRLREMSNTVSQ